MTDEPLNKRIEQLERLLDVGNKLSALLELEPLLQTIISAAADLTNSQEASILMYDARTEDLAIVASPCLGDEPPGRLHLSLSGTVAGQVFTSGQPMTVVDAAGDELFSRSAESELDCDTYNILAVPMQIKGEVTGVLTAVNKLDDEPFTDQDQHILETLAAQAAIAIQNANLLKQAQDAYEELSKFDQVKSDFIAITSHELRTPLGLILGHATFMQEMVPKELKPQVDVIIDAAMRLKDIVDDLSKVNNFETGMSRVRRRQVNINQLLQQITSSCRSLAKENKIELELNLPAEEIHVEGDNEKIGIAVNHLVRNALIFNDPGGKAIVNLKSTSDQIQIEVIDNGIGIPARDIDRIFDRFYQVESHMTRKHGGMGLGLPVSRMMVEMHKGSIEVESVEGKGSKFTIQLPLKQPEAG